MTTYVLFVFILTLFWITTTVIAGNAILTTCTYSRNTFRFTSTFYRVFIRFHLKGQSWNREFWFVLNKEDIYYLKFIQFYRLCSFLCFALVSFITKIFYRNVYICNIKLPVIFVFDYKAVSFSNLDLYRHRPPSLNYHRAIDKHSHQLFLFYFPSFFS